MKEFDVDNTDFFINLTTGLEHLLNPNFHSLFRNPQFVRLQSTHCENKLWEKFIQEVDNNLLMKLALGKTCIILDCTSRKLKGNNSRACWQGLAWLRYCIEKTWFNRKIRLDYGMHDYFEKQYKKLSRCTKKRLKYYRKFLKCDEVSLEYFCEPTDNDGNTEYYKKIVENYL